MQEVFGIAVWCKSSLGKKRRSGHKVSSEVKGMSEV